MACAGTAGMSSGPCSAKRLPPEAAALQLPEEDAPEEEAAEPKLAPALTLATRRILSMALMRKQPSMRSSDSSGRRSSALTASCVSAVAPHSDSRNGRAPSPAHQNLPGQSLLGPIVDWT